MQTSHLKNSKARGLGNAEEGLLDKSPDWGIIATT
jgi:hypothetical protein